MGLNKLKLATFVAIIILVGAPSVATQIIDNRTIKPSQTTLSSVNGASNPEKMLRIPLFSLGPDSISLKGLSPSATTNAVLTTYLPDSLQLIPATELGLGRQDDITDFSLNASSYIDTNEEFVLMFSVDRNTRGNVMPDPDLVEAGFEHNVLDQATRRQAAGDAFFSTLSFTRTGPSTDDPLKFNNVLSVNNFDEGGRDFVPTQMQMQPYQPSAEVVFPSSSLGDDVDALAATPDIGRDSVLPLYFVVSDGTNIFVLTEGGVSIYASAERLGLNYKDKIDGLEVFDSNYNCVFDDADQILISLAPESPSLKITNGGPADIYSVALNEAGAPVIELFAPAEYLGLEKLGNVDALTIIGVGEKSFDPISFAREWGIPKHG